MGAFYAYPASLRTLTVATHTLRAEPLSHTFRKGIPVDSMVDASTGSMQSSTSAPTQHPKLRPKRRELFCPAHPEQRVEENAKKYFLHLAAA